MAKTIGIFLAGQNGDIMTAASVLKYRKELWGDAKIIWWMEDRNMDLLAHHQNLELRTFPRGWGYPERCVEENKKPNEPLWEDWSPLVTSKNHLNLSLKMAYPSLADVDYGYFPAPHQLTPEQRHGLSYPEVSRRVFGCEDKEWHPVLAFTAHERVKTWDFVNTLRGKRVFIETFAGSGQSSLDIHMVNGIMDECRRKWGECSFVFGSHKFLRTQEEFPPAILENSHTYFCSPFTVRETALISTNCDLMISVSSGLTVAASSWGRTPVPILQFCGSEVCGTRLLANGPFEMVTADDKFLDTAKEEFFLLLNRMLNKYK